MVKRLIAVIGDHAHDFERCWITAQFRDHELELGKIYPEWPSIVFDEDGYAETEYRFFRANEETPLRGMTLYGYRKMERCAPLTKDFLALVRVACERHPKKRGRGI